MTDYIIFIEDISNDIKSSVKTIIECQNNIASITNKVEQTCITIIHERRLIDEYYYTIFTKETLPIMQEYVLYKTKLISQIVNLFQTIISKFYKYLEENKIEIKIKINYELDEQLMYIRKNLDTLVQNITFYKSI